MLAVTLETNYAGSSPTISIILYAARAVESVLAGDFKNKLHRFESHYRHIYVAQAVERLLAAAFVNKLCWFDAK